MEARDMSDKIRLLPPDAPTEPPDDGRPSERPWLGPVVVAGVIALFALVIGLGSSPDDAGSADAEDAAAPSLGVDIDSSTTTEAPRSTTTTAPPPPPLLDQVPDLASELYLAGTVANADGSSNIVTALWNGRLPAPGSASVFDRTFPLEMRFASNSRMLAVLGARLSDGTATLYVGSTSSLSPQFVGVTSFAWVESDALELAFVGQPPGVDSAGLYHAAVAPSGAMTDITRITDVAPAARVAGAGEWGYLLMDGTFISVTTRLDLDGAPLRSVAGVVLDVAADGDFVLASAQSALDTALAAGATPEELGFTVEPVTITNTQFAILDIDFNQLQMSQAVLDVLGSGWIEFSPDGSLVIGTAPSVGDRWSVRTASLEQALGRTTSIVGATGYLGWSSDGTYLMYETDEGMAFHNWDRGTTHYVNFDKDYVLLTVGS